MEETRKRNNEQNDADSSASPLKRPRPTEEDGSGELGEDIMAWLSMDDETVTVGELMNFLDTTPLTRVKFIDNPYTSPLIFQSSSSYVTINGNEESCGSSFSDSDSSFMVNVDMEGIMKVAREGFREWWGAGFEFESSALSSNVVVEEGGGFLKGGEMDGCDDGWDFDDYMLARFLGEKPL